VYVGYPTLNRRAVQCCPAASEVRMNRPFPVTVIGCVFIIAGAVGLVYHLWQGPYDRWIVPVSIVRL